MSDEIKTMSVFDIFEQTQMTLQEAEEKARKEASKKIERYRISEDGEYVVRILPLAPTLDADGKLMPMSQKGYEYPLQQMFIEIKVPTKPGKKAQSQSIPVIRATQKEVGYSVDLIDKYADIAREMYPGDDDLMKKISENAFSGGLKWNFVHLLYVLDLDSKERKGPLIWQISNSLYKEIELKKISLWKREEAKSGEKRPCIVSSMNAYPVIINRTNENGKVKYIVDIDRDIDRLSEEELNKLMEMQRIHEFAYQFSRRTLEAELVFLKQFDERFGINVCEQKDFKEAYQTLSDELPAEDTSHFTIGQSADGKKSEADSMTIDDLWAENDKLADAGVRSGSAEYNELREKIRIYAENKRLDVRLAHSKSNQQLLEEIEHAEEEGIFIQDENSKKPEKKPEPKQEVKEEAAERPSRRRRPLPVDDEVEQAAPEKKDNVVSEPEQVEEKEPEPAVELPKRRRR